MPELPEVEIMTRNLHRWASGRVLRELVLLDDRMDRGGLADLCATSASRQVQRVWRRGKYSVMELAGRDATVALVLHFRMTGKVVVADAGARAGERLRLHFVPEAGRPESVRFVDARHLGTAEVRPLTDLEGWFQQVRGLGPEPWPEPRGAGFWQRQLGRSRSPVKVALMQQDKVAGLGNIAASEILWRAGVHPARKACELSAADWARVAAAVPDFIEATIARESGDEIAYVNSRGGSARGVASPFEVYRNDGQPCPRCHTPVARGKHAGRSTFWCPACQEAG